jgi:hypothetical protein
VFAAMCRRRDGVKHLGGGRDGVAMVSNTSAIPRRSRWCQTPRRPGALAVGSLCTPRGAQGGREAPTEASNTPDALGIAQVRPRSFSGAAGTFSVIGSSSPSAARSSGSSASGTAACAGRGHASGTACGGRSLRFFRASCSAKRIASRFPHARERPARVEAHSSPHLLSVQPAETEDSVSVGISVDRLGVHAPLLWGNGGKPIGAPVAVRNVRRVRTSPHRGSG